MDQKICATPGVVYLDDLEDILQAEYDTIKKNKTERLDSILQQLGCFYSVTSSKVFIGWNGRNAGRVFISQRSSLRKFPGHGGEIIIENDTVYGVIKGWTASTDAPLYTAIVYARGNFLVCFFKTDITKLAESILKNGMVAMTMNT